MSTQLALLFLLKVGERQTIQYCGLAHVIRLNCWVSEEVVVCCLFEILPLAKYDVKGRHKIRSTVLLPKRNSLKKEVGADNFLFLVALVHPLNT